MFHLHAFGRDSSNTAVETERERERDQCFHLAFHQHGHVHEHVVKLPDTVFQLDNLIVPRLDLIHCLLGDVVHNYLRRYKIKEVVTDRWAPAAFFMFCFFVFCKTYPRGEDGWIVTFQHALQLLVCCVSSS